MARKVGRKARGLLREHVYAAILLVLVSWFAFADDSGPSNLSSKPKDCGDRTKDFVCLILTGELAGTVNVPADSNVLFEPNLGQTSEHSDYIAHQGRAEYLLSSTGPVVRLGSARVQASFEDARTFGDAQALDARPGRVHYLKGNDPSRWITDVPTYGQVRYRNVYPGVDVVYYGKGRMLEHDFVFAPGADPQKIRMRFDSADKLTVGRDGALTLESRGYSVVWRKPALYQVSGRQRIPLLF